MHVFTEFEIKKIMSDITVRGIQLDTMCQAHVTAIGLRLGKKDLNLGNRVSSTKVEDLVSQLK